MMDWLVVALGGGWLFREFAGKAIHHISENKLLKTRNETEFDYHRKKYIYETRSPIYRELYKFSKIVHGTGASLIQLKNSGFSIRIEAVEVYFLNKYQNFDDDLYTGNTKQSFNYRKQMNLKYHYDTFMENLITFQNISGENSVLLTNDINWCTEHITTQSKRIGEYLRENFEKYMKDDFSNPIINVINDEYELEIKLLRKLIDKMFVFMQCELSIIEEKEVLEKEIKKIEDEINKIYKELNYDFDTQ